MTNVQLAKANFSIPFKKATAWQCVKAVGVKLSPLVSAIHNFGKVEFETSRKEE